MSFPRKSLAVAVMASVLAGCYAKDKNSEVRVLHASADAPMVNATIGRNVRLNDIDYKEGTKLRVIREGTQSVTVQGQVPGGLATVIDTELELEADKEYTIIAVGDVAAIEPLVVTAPDDDVDGDAVRAQVVHAASAAPAVDVYVTDPATGLGSAAPLGSFAFKGTLGPVNVPAGDYRIRVTPAGNPSTVVFDSGTVALTGGSELLIAAVNNTAAGDAPISLVVLDGAGSAEILDANTPADLRVVHLSPDAGVVDVIANNAVTLVDDLDFAEVADFQSVSPGDYLVDVFSETLGVTGIDDAPVSLAAGMRYSALAQGFALTSPALNLQATEDDIRSIATESKLRVIHGSPSAGTVDVYLTDQTTTAGDLGAMTPALAGFEFQANTDFLSLAPGDYRVFVTVAGTTAVAIGPLDVTLAGGDVVTAIARDGDTTGTFDVLLLDDTP